MEPDLVKRIYEQYAKEIYLYLLALSKDPYMSEDILQDVFCKAICSLPDSHTNIRAWLYRVAKNTYINEWKKNKRGVSMENVEGEATIDVFENTVLQKILKTQENTVLYKGIMELPQRQRKVLILQYFSGLSIKEIAYAIKISQENVRVLAHRGRTQLRKYMEDNGYDVS